MTDEARQTDAEGAAQARRGVEGQSPAVRQPDQPRAGGVPGLCEGESVTAIAARCVVSVATVRTQVRAILFKLGVGSQLEAVAWHTATGGTTGPADALRTA